jgi:hypothetical protein
MKADARPSAEKEALSWAIEFFRTRARYLNPKSFRENNLKYVEQCAEDWFVLPEGEREEQLNELAELAIFDGDGFATMYLCELAIKHIGKEMPFPPKLRLFTFFRLRWPNVKWHSEARNGASGLAGARIKKSPGPSSDEFLLRNGAILTAVAQIIDKWKFQATRSPASTDKRVSAASIVRDAIETGAGRHLTEAAINKIWNEHGGDFLTSTGRAHLKRSR